MTNTSDISLSLSFPNTKLQAIAFHGNNAELQAAGAGVLRLLCGGHRSLGFLIMVLCLAGLTFWVGVDGRDRMR